MKQALIFIGGAAFGFLAGWFCLKSFYARRTEREIEEIQDHYRKKSGELPKKEQDDPVFQVERKKAEEIIRYNQYGNSAYPKIDRKQLDPLNGSAEDAGDPAEIPPADRTDSAPWDEDDEDETDDGSDPASAKPPYFITEDDFGEYPGQEMETLYYYEENGVILDDNDCFVDRVEKILGEDALTGFGDDDRIFIRNERNRTDYEIIRYRGAYEE